MRSDADIQQAVLRELQWDPRVDGAEVGVSVDDGVVILSGIVGVWAKKLAAQEAAHRVLDVLDVANDLEVVHTDGTTRTDPEIARAVRHALEWTLTVPAERIQTTVSKGWLTLEGDVDAWYQREDAEIAVRNLDGVRGVTSRVVLRPAKVSADDIRDEIEEALERRAERATKHLQIMVGQDGTVTLSGPIHSHREREAIVGAARHTRGVRTIDDRLYIDLGT